MSEGTAGNAMAPPAKDPKHSTLFELYHQISEVVSNLHTLNSKLGVYNDVPMPCTGEEVKQPPNPDTLVAVIDRLPDMLGGKISELHNLLNELENSLI